MTTRCIHLGDILEVVADAVPDRIAVTTGSLERSYRELDERATRLANHLSGLGIGAGDRVAIHAENCIEWVEAFYACFKIRAAPININFRYVAHELNYLYDNAECVAAIVAPRFVDLVESLRPVLPRLAHILAIGPDYEAALAAASPARDFGPRSPDDEYVIYTGGTTGMPKGVVWRQEDVVLGAMNTMRQGRPIDRVEQLADEAVASPFPLRLLTVGPLMHGGSQWIMGAAHVAGGGLVLYCHGGFDAFESLKLAAKTQASVFATLGDAIGRPLAEAIMNPKLPRLDLSKLMIIGNGAAPLSSIVREQLKKALPHAMVLDSYGASETGAAASRPGADADGHAAPRFNAGPDVAVLRPDLTGFCLPGEVGLLARSGPIPLGYIKDPERTGKTFPVIDGKRWVVPGDFARIEDDGSVSLLGRGSTSINTGGEKVYPEEVEAALKEHAAVLDAAVIGTPHPRWGEQVTALVEVRPGHTASRDELRAHCRPLIAAYKIPKEILFVEVVPRTAVGKVDYPQVKQLAVEMLGPVPTS